VAPVASGDKRKTAGIGLSNGTSATVNRRGRQTRGEKVPGEPAPGLNEVRPESSSSTMAPRIPRSQELLARMPEEGAATAELEWVILKMSRPMACGGSWLSLMRESWRERLTVIGQCRSASQRRPARRRRLVLGNVR